MQATIQQRWRPWRLHIDAKSKGFHFNLIAARTTESFSNFNFLQFSLLLKLPKFRVEFNSSPESSNIKIRPNRSTKSKFLQFFRKFGIIRTKNHYGSPQRVRKFKSLNNGLLGNRWRIAFVVLLVVAMSICSIGFDNRKVLNSYAKACLTKFARKAWDSAAGFAIPFFGIRKRLCGFRLTVTWFHCSCSLCAISSPRGIYSSHLIT